MRLIDADALIETIRNFVDTMSVCTSTDYCNGLRFMKKQAIEAIENATTVEPASPWHRVEDELPKSGEFGEIVIACNDVGTVKVAYLLSNGKWYAANNTDWDAWTWMPNVTHWMPMPPPQSRLCKPN